MNCTGKMPEMRDMLQRLKEYKHLSARYLVRRHSNRYSIASSCATQEMRNILSVVRPRAACNSILYNDNMKTSSHS